MIDNNILKTLVCPEDRTPLALASSEQIDALNREIAAGRLRNRAGQPLAEPLDGGLIRQDGRYLYPIVDDIPLLLIDEAIALEPSANN